MTASRTVRGAAHWRLRPEFSDEWCRVRLPSLNPNASLESSIYPPIAGCLPNYELVIEDSFDKGEFRTWVLTLSVEDQSKVQKATILERIT